MAMALSNYWIVFQTLLLLSTLYRYEANCTALENTANGIDLTGTWKCNDGGLYYIRQLSNTVWWSGVQQVPSGYSVGFSNVLYGTIQSSIINAQWCDVPFGRNRLNGSIAVEIISATELRKKSFTGGFGGSIWNKQ
ncbi:unnamed protein product [Rotaria socialis]|uniref:Uncharacterized protein n=1 Tax=Rotaria socialis TaxID=392032 RepID=A0A817VH06_9BILA|nr:unnamed protein product [Rotaria socialis]CAF3342566.1 unnamed protein product [Rotaria socialis]CAF3471863.1 unnamed protein product [Rotaria socialis]CAF4324794.1 unnamed protein product [Rotaria socialis]CAF4448355.1 unnamed protein product [Rotaria socialis]